MPCNLLDGNHQTNSHLMRAMMGSNNRFLAGCWVRSEDLVKDARPSTSMPLVHSEPCPSQQAEPSPPPNIIQKHVAQAATILSASCNRLLIPWSMKDVIVCNDWPTTVGQLLHGEICTPLNNCIYYNAVQIFPSKISYQRLHSGSQHRLTAG